MPTRSRRHKQILEQHSYAEIKHYDWLNIVMGLGTGNLSALFQHSVATCNNSCWWPYSRLGPLAISAPIPLFLSFLHLQFTVNKCHKSCWWLDSNPGPLVFSKATSVEAINTASSWAVVVVQLVAFKARGPRFESSHR